MFRVEFAGQQFLENGFDFSGHDVATTQPIDIALHCRSSIQRPKRVAQLGVHRSRGTKIHRSIKHADDGNILQCFSDLSIGKRTEQNWLQQTHLLALRAHRIDSSLCGSCRRIEDNNHGFRVLGEICLEERILLACNCREFSPNFMINVEDLAHRLFLSTLELKQVVRKNQRSDTLHMFDIQQSTTQGSYSDELLNGGIIEDLNRLYC